MESGVHAPTAATGASTPIDLGIAQDRLHHSLTLDGTSVLALAIDQSRGLVYCGLQSGAIYVCDIRTQQRCAKLVGHSRSVLALEFAQECGWLFSSSCTSAKHARADDQRTAPYACGTRGRCSRSR